MDKDQQALYEALLDPRRTIYLAPEARLTSPGRDDIIGVVPPVPVSSLGSSVFCREFGLKYAYVGGSMVGAVSSETMVKALAEAGCLGFYGASGMSPAAVEAAVAGLKKDLPESTFGSCLIHTPHDPSWEEKVVEIYLKHGVRVIEASAFMQLSLSLVRYRLNGLRRLPDGRISSPNRIIAKVSRLELAKRFFSPPPDKLVRELLNRGWITPEEAELAPSIPMAQDLTAEADSGGHTDFRPAITLWPAMVASARDFTEKFGYHEPLRVGMGGGLGTPWAFLAAQALGAAYFVVGSVHQSCLESGLAPAGRALLAKAAQTDVAQGPAADMFELGAKVQVLKFGVLYAMRAQKLAEAYRQYASIEEIPATERETMETQIFKQTLAETWNQTRSFFETRDPSQLEKAAADPKYKMALVFRWYLGQASRWAIAGDENRRADWQIFCGPAQGAFNDWTKGSPLEKPEERRVAEVAMNFLYAAAVLKRLNLAKTLGAWPPDFVFDVRPKALSEIARYI